MELETRVNNNTQAHLDAEEQDTKPPPQPPPEPRKRFIFHSKKEPYDFVAFRNVKKPTKSESDYYSEREAQRLPKSKRTAAEALSDSEDEVHSVPKKSASSKAAAASSRKTIKKNKKLQDASSAIESTGHLIKGCLGGGILGIHEAFSKNGLWASLFLTVIFGFYITYCVHLLIKSAQVLYERLHVPEMSYPDVAQASLEIGPFPRLRKYGKWFRYAVDMMICIDLFGACCVYQIIIAETIKQLIEEAYSLNTGGLDQLRFYILALLVPILLLCMITTLKYLAPFTLVADLFIVVCVVATVVYSMRVVPPISEVPAWKNALGFFEFCGIAIFSMEGIGVSLPIENNMKNPRQFPLILCCGMFVVVLFLILVGFFGYWGFGESAKAPVTLNFPSETFPTVLKCLMALMIFVTFALNFWAPFNLVWHYVAKKHNPQRFWLWERVYRATFIVAITATAIAFPNIGNLMGLLGAFCLSNLGFIFPAVIDLLVVWEDPGLGTLKWRLWKNLLVLMLGIIFFVAGTYSNVNGLIKSLYKS